jgi:hypothetical protein
MLKMVSVSNSYLDGMYIIQLSSSDSSGEKHYSWSSSDLGSSGVAILSGMMRI